MDIETKISCTHCGDDCTSAEIHLDNKIFCCNGCLMVYQLLKDNNLSDYYAFDQNPGITIKSYASNKFDFLDDEVSHKILLFDEGGISKVRLILPQIHCSACLYLLENLSKLNQAIFYTKVNFLRKEATIQFDSNEMSLKALVELLTKIGYEPILQFDQLENKRALVSNKTLLLKIGLAGFAFGNIMLLSFPEYLGFSEARSQFYLGYINIALIIPVLLYSASDYFKSAFTSLKQGNLNLDFPIVLGILTLFFRSVYEILFHIGEGYLDSLSGFVFFLLIGKWFQSVTYHRLDFERSYASYFPISTTVKSASKWITKSIDKVVVGDKLMIRNEELIPVDSILLKGNGRIDYSFVTGESSLIRKVSGDTILAGGRQVGESIIVEVTKDVSQSKLTQLWNEHVFKNKTVSSSTRLVQSISKYFTIAILSIALITFTVWLFIDSSRSFTIFTSVLIVACPCALALAIPFTYGNILRLLSKSGFHIRNIEVIENIQDINHIVFDKTGTITDCNNMTINFEGEQLDDSEMTLIKSVCLHSAHPLSKSIVQYFHPIPTVDIDTFEDFIGEGLEGKVMGNKIRLGSDAFVFNLNEKIRSGVFVEINGMYKGFFTFEQALRKNISNIISNLKESYDLSLLSGDSNKENNRMRQVFGETSMLQFNASPKEKLVRIQELQNNGLKVMMVGDGLNDAGALKQSNVGIVIADNVNNFSPACDAIIDAQNFDKFGEYIKYIKIARQIIWGAFILAFCYNAIGLGFAITGHLSPVVAAILMPLSSITVMIYGLVSSALFFRIKK